MFLKQIIDKNIRYFLVKMPYIFIFTLDKLYGILILRNEYVFNNELKTRYN